MALITALVRELAGLFVDDGSLALLALVWIGLCALARLLIPALGLWGGPLLFAGLALILLESAGRAARRRR